MGGLKERMARGALLKYYKDSTKKHNMIDKNE